MSQHYVRKEELLCYSRKQLVQSIIKIRGIRFGKTCNLDQVVLRSNIPQEIFLYFLILGFGFY